MESSDAQSEQDEGGAGTNPRPFNLVDAIVSILRDSSGEMFSAALGNRLAKKAGKPLAEVLEGETLTEFLQRRLAKDIVLTGTKDRRLVSLIRSTISEPELPFRDDQVQRPKPQKIVSRKYDRSFWNAFIRPARRHRVRAVCPQPPYASGDYLLDEIPEGYLAVDASLLTDATEPRYARNNAAALGIEKWCDRHGFSPEQFAEQRSPSRSSSTTINIEGAKALLAMVRAVPPEKRERLSLPINVVLSLLDPL